MVRVCGINTTYASFLLPMGLVRSHNARPSRSRLRQICAWNLAHSVDETRYQGFGDGFAVLDEAGAECDGDDDSILRFVNNAGIFAVLEGWFEIGSESSWWTPGINQ
jgi:hypothetical protein